MPKVLADLNRRRCIRARMASGKLYRWEFERRGEVILIDAPGTLTLDESSLMVEVALAGAGLPISPSRSSRSTLPPAS